MLLSSWSAKLLLQTEKYVDEAIDDVNTDSIIMHLIRVHGIPLIRWVNLKKHLGVSNTNIH